MKDISHADELLNSDIVNFQNFSNSTKELETQLEALYSKFETHLPNIAKSLYSNISSNLYHLKSEIDKEFNETVIKTIQNNKKEIANVRKNGDIFDLLQILLTGFIDIIDSTKEFWKTIKQKHFLLALIIEKSVTEAVKYITINYIPVIGQILFCCHISYTFASIATAGIKISKLKEIETKTKEKLNNLDNATELPGLTKEIDLCEKTAKNLSIKAEDLVLLNIDSSQLQKFSTSPPDLQTKEFIQQLVITANKLPKNEIETNMLLDLIKKNIQKELTQHPKLQEYSKELIKEIDKNTNITNNLGNISNVNSNIISRIENTTQMLKHITNVVHEVIKDKHAAKVISKNIKTKIINIVLEKPINKIMLQKASLREATWQNKALDSKNSKNLGASK